MTAFVLVHDAWHGGWCWRHVAKTLRAQGHDVYVPTLTGMGERAHLASSGIDLNTHVLDVLGVLEYEDLDHCVLTGHGYAGFVISGAAERSAPRIAHMVFLDALVPRDGLSAAHVMGATHEEIEASTQGGGEGWRVPPRTMDELGIPDMEEQRWVAPRFAGQPVRTFTHAIRLANPAAAAIPRTYLRCVAPPLAVFDASAGAAKAAGWRYKELAATHDAMFSDPAGLAAELLAVAGG